MMKIPDRGRPSSSRNVVLVVMIVAVTLLALLAIYYVYRSTAPQTPQETPAPVITVTATSLSVSTSTPSLAPPADVATQPATPGLGTPSLAEEAALGSVVAETDVNVRNGPGTDFEVVGLLKAGEKAEVVALDDSQKWVGIKYAAAQDGTGWVSADFVSRPEAMQDVPTPNPDAASVTADANVNIRAGPGTNYEQVGVLNAGESAAVLGKSSDGQWWQISIAGGQGWVSSQYVTASNTETVPTVEPPP